MTRDVRLPARTGNLERHPHAHPSYSAQGQDRVLREILTAQLDVVKQAGEIRYVELGTAHPISANNTYLFYTAGARGLLVEPNPALVEQIRRYRPKDTVVQCGIVSEQSAEQASAPYYVFADNYWRNTFSYETAERVKAKFGYAYEVEEQPVMTINRLLREFGDGGEIDLLALDIEGLDEVILTELDYDAFAPRIICGEIGHASGELLHALDARGYTLAAKLPTDSIFVRGALR